MTDRDGLGDEPVTPEELAAARRLADALEGDRTAAADVQALAVARLVEAVSATEPGDEVAARRLRDELAGRAARRPRMRAVARAAALAAAVAAAVSLSVYFRRAPVQTDAGVLLAREEAARAAVVAVAGSWGAGYEPGERIAAVSERQWRLRLAAQLDAARFEQLAARDTGNSTVVRGHAAPRTTRSVPTPGGTS